MTTVSSERSLAALDKAILYAFAATLPKRPGAVIERMRDDDREALRDLTSDAASKQRCDLSARVARRKSR